MIDYQLSLVNIWCYFLRGVFMSFYEFDFGALMDSF